MRRRTTTVCAVVLMVLLTGWTAPAAVPLSVRRVVILYPDSEGRPGNQRFGDAVRLTFTEAKQQLEVYNEYLDATRFSTPEFQQQYAAFLRNKYQHLKIDVVIAPLLPSVHFLLRYRSECFPGVPVVYAAVDERDLESLKLGDGVVGIPMRIELARNLELALRLQPATRRAYVVIGDSDFDRLWEARARTEFEALATKVEIVYLRGLSLHEIEAEIHKSPTDSIIYYFHVSRDREGVVRTPAHFLEQLIPRVARPVYGHVDTYLGRGIVGGYLLSFEDEGKQAARLALDLLNGTKPNRALANTQAKLAVAVDDRQLKRWGIDESHLPAGTIIEHRSLTLWDNYHWHIIGIISLTLLEAFLIALLLLQRRSIRKAESLFRQSVEAAPNGMILMDRDGRIILANTQMERLFGYERQDLLRQTLEVLVPHGKFPGNEVSGRGVPPSQRVTAPGDTLQGQHRDGSTFPVEINVQPVTASHQAITLATVIDVSQQKRFEAALRESNRELITLTRRLMRAQETERRRIARELHDDLNQNLALVSVELDLLVQQLREREPQLTSCLQTISERVKQLSTSVHELSHQLHPSKVEQLGLVTSLRSLCLELQKSHDLAIEYVEAPVLQPIPAEVALCLYRIAQEALRNVIKHSQARQATVELSCSEHGLMMVITDDGVGFDPAEATWTGLGLLSMRERLSLVNGQLTIDSLPGRGTRIEVTIAPTEETPPDLEPIFVKEITTATPHAVHLHAQPTP